MSTHLTRGLVTPLFHAGILHFPRLASLLGTDLDSVMCDTVAGGGAHLLGDVVTLLHLGQARHQLGHGPGNSQHIQRDKG